MAAEDRRLNEEDELDLESAEELAACLLAARRNRLPDDAEWRTPWERGADSELVDYELSMILRSAENMNRLGLM